ncbi:hypothetical protein GWN26_08445, partial [Candidatus Saccharibacteria bacterium]|nr:hypothetical protein [Candidatus Saccharibacteria bacterium]NIV03886.1 hypothetical protein [Calditrichia bacterium]NIS38451.1 hypothetical protein [Candidatus Saccharibacteria bacterium]NIV72219.1 hypothetical protein [Calditrichia bacterium]NIV99160.1 hypothetical protein [Candidatus Saccharibacteria bacterium]
MGKKSTVFVKTIKGTFSGNLGNLWELGKTKYEMLDNSSKKTVKSDFVFAGRPMITKSTKTQAPRLFGFESPLYLDPDSHERLINAVPADVLDTEEAPFLQFVHSAASWIRGYKLSEAKNGEIDPEYHPKLGRAHRISVRDPQLRYQVRVDDD